MSSGSSGAALADGVRRAAEAVIASGDVRFDNGEERPLGAKGRRTRAAILRGAGDAFAAHGWTATTITSIAHRAGVGTGTIYQYFRSKEDVLAALVGEWTLAALGQLRAWDPKAGREGLRTLIGSFVTGYATTAAFQRVWEEVSLIDPRLAELRTDISEVYVRLFADAFVDGRAAGLLDVGPEPVETARALCAMVDRYCHQVFVQGAAHSTPSEVAELITDLWGAAIHLR
jgi:AcrR family transcriptional regulator